VGRGCPGRLGDGGDRQAMGEETVLEAHAIQYNSVSLPMEAPEFFFGYPANWVETSLFFNFSLPTW
jgi:hypothetical protein